MDIYASSSDQSSAPCGKVADTWDLVEEEVVEGKSEALVGKLRNS